MLLTTTTAWAVGLTTNIEYIGINASEVTVQVTYNNGATTETVTSGQTVWNIGGQNVTVAVTSAKIISTTFSATYLWFGTQDEPLAVHQDGNTCTFTTNATYDNTLNIRVTYNGSGYSSYTMTQNGSVNMPRNGTTTVNIPNGVTKFYVYDDGGPSGNFSDGCNGQVLLIAPEGKLLKVNGTVTGGAYLVGGVTEYARLALYDGSSTSATMLYHNSYGSVSNIISSGKQMLLHFYDINNVITETDAGFSLTVEVIEPTTAHSITIADGITHGTVTADKTSAAVGETVTLTVTTDVGYELDYFTGATLTSIGNNQYTFIMPDEDVTISASFHVSSLFGYKYWPDDIYNNYNPDGSADKPYIISTAAGWNLLCDCLAEENNTTWNRFSGKTVKLGANIEVTRMAGSQSHDFCGTFDGKQHTLTFNYGTSDSYANTEYAAPFHYVSNVNSVAANFKDLHVAGHIYTSAKYAAGLIAQHWGTVNIENCRVSTVIHSSVAGDGTHGGIEAVNVGELNITGCVFDGKLLTTGTTPTKNCGGFVGWHNSGTTNISNSLYAPATLGTGETEVLTGDVNDHPSATFGRDAVNSITNSYYTRTLGTAQGTAPFIYNSLPVGIGTKGTTYDVSGITVYDNGLAYGGKYYTAPLATHTLTANLADDNYWTTFYCGDADYTITTDGAYAYTAEYEGTNQQLTLTKRGADIPKGSAVIIMGGGNGTDATVGISLTKTSGLAAYSGTNDLDGVDVRTEKSTLGTGTFYVMGKKGDDFGFFQYTAQYMPAGKAYLLINGGAALANGLKMVFDDGETSGLSEMRNEKGEMRNGNAWYTLSGTRLSAQPTQPGLYINNGKKVVVK